MNRIISSTTGQRPLLLVSVRNAAEAIEALAGGADVIDIKEPSRGPLGMADRERVEEVVRCVNKRRPVSMAAGELFDARPENLIVPEGVRWTKFGLSNCAEDSDWLAEFAHVKNRLPTEVQIVPVAYADWRAACAPPPEVVLAMAQSCECSMALVDTFDKSAGKLFDHWAFSMVEKFVVSAHAIGTQVALAGGLREEDVACAVATGADVIGVRGAVCDAGRLGKLHRERVESLVVSIQRTASCAVGD